MEHLQTQGISLPRLGLGTFRMQGDACRAAVESALTLGYRHIDTAEMYGNEEAIGAAIAASRVARRAGSADSMPSILPGPRRPRTIYRLICDQRAVIRNTWLVMAYSQL